MELETKLGKKIIMKSDGKFMKFHEENFFISLSLSYFFSTKFHAGIPELSWKYFAKENLKVMFMKFHVGLQEWP